MAYLLGRNDEFDLGGISTHGYYEVLTKLDIKKLEKSLNRTIKEQSMFRTVFLKKWYAKSLKICSRVLNHSGRFKLMQ